MQQLKLNLRGLIWKIFLSNFDLLNFPYKLNFAVTNKCNSRCKTCNIWKKRACNELSLSEIEKIFKEINFFSWINLTGGEPFLRKDLVDIVEVLHKNCKDLFILNIPTNGFFPSLTYKKVEEMLSLNIPWYIVTVSLDGPRKEHQKIRGISKAWEKSIETYKNLKQLANESKNLDVFFEFTLSPYNLGLFERTFYEAKSEIQDLNLNDFVITIFHCSHYYNNLHQSNLLLEFRKNLYEEVDRILAFRKNHVQVKTLIHQIYLSLAKQLVNSDRTLNCKALFSSCFLDACGNLYPCIIYDRKMCNLRDNDYNIKTCLSMKSIDNVKKDIKELKCPGCWTPCEANQTIVGNILKSLFLYKKGGGKIT